ncbi:MAG TPA: hypothetical protein VG329_03485 [Candidatus Dormibacteraeota bacterium]|jgi:hypothetical protein|nr:hypothetical protein [Candidatus Dormibacteraeota bacterium]
MARDPDGYGYDPNEDPIDRLVEDLRTLSPAGIERMAWGWDQRESGEAYARYHEAEKAALRMIEEQRRAEGWEELRRKVLDMTEGRSSLVAWRAEHGDVGHKAEAAALAAALALYAGSALPNEPRRALLAAGAEALPWLLPDLPPDPYEEPEPKAAEE